MLLRIRGLLLESTVCVCAVWVRRALGRAMHPTAVDGLALERGPRPEHRACFNWRVNCWCAPPGSPPTPPAA